MLPQSSHGSCLKSPFSEMNIHQARDETDDIDRKYLQLKIPTENVFLPSNTEWSLLTGRRGFLRELYQRDRFELVSNLALYYRLLSRVIIFSYCWNNKTTFQGRWRDGWLLTWSTTVPVLQPNCNQNKQPAHPALNWWQGSHHGTDGIHVNTEPLEMS